MSLRIDDVSLNAIVAYTSVSLDIISIFATKEHLGVASHKCIATISVINFLVESISSKLL